MDYVDCYKVKELMVQYYILFDLKLDKDDVDRRVDRGINNLIYSIYKRNSKELKKESRKRRKLLKSKEREKNKKKRLVEKKQSKLLKSKGNVKKNKKKCLAEKKQKKKGKFFSFFTKKSP